MSLVAAVMGAVFFDSFRASIEALVGDMTIIVATHLWTLLSATLLLAIVCLALPVPIAPRIGSSLTSF